MFLKVFRKSSLFLSSYLPCWSKSPQDKLKIAPRTRQDGPRRPTTANMGPTWGQHRPNMGPKRSAKGSKNQVPGGSEARIAIRSQHGPQIDPKWAPNWTNFRIMLGSSWDNFGIMMGSSSDHFGVMFRQPPGAPGRGDYCILNLL